MIENSTFKSKYINFGTYHRHHLNKLIHAIFTPGLVFGILGLLEHTNIYFFDCHYFTLGTALFTLLSLYHLTIDFISGLFTYIIYLSLCLLSHYFFLSVNAAFHIKMSIIIGILSYGIAQMGHSYIQKRKPPTDVFINGVAAVPLFCMAQVMFFFGWRKQLRQVCNTQISQRIKLLNKE